tara:strand:- start:4459 stop:5931 length:1473 start_codon:yes stop_codon:yes gene_type:complete
MSLLTTFGILFETDAEKAKREVDEVDKSLSNTEQTANDTADSFDELGSSVDESADSFFGLSEGLVSAAAGLVVVTGLFAGITSQALATDEIGKFTETLGLSIEEVGAWGEAVKRSGGDAASFRGSLESLTGQLTDISLTGGGEASEVFARLGVDAVGAGGKIKSAFEILPELADSFQNLSRAESFAFGQKLGLDQGTILLLQQGRVAVEELVQKQKELGVATKEDAAAAAEFNDALADNQQTFANLFTSAGTTILPLLTTMMKGFDSLIDWVGENETLVTGFFIAVAGAITYIYLPAILSAAAATLVAMSPFLLIGAAIAAVGVAFALLYEDVVAFVNGQESFIGDLAKKYEWFGDIVEGVVGGIKKSFEVLTEFFDDIMNSIPDITNAFGDAFNDAKSFFGFGDDELNASLDKALSVTGSIDNNPLNGQTSASIVNSQQSSSRVNHVTVGSTTVNTQATDAAGVASAVGDNLNNQISMAIEQFDDVEAY